VAQGPQWQEVDGMSGKQEFRGMKGLKKQRRIQIIALATLALIGSTALIGYAMRDGINFFRSPTQVLEEPPATGETFRIGGLVVEGSIVRGEGTEVAFEVTDTNATVAVRYNGVLPDLFSEGQGMVALGRMEGDVFQATEVLAKHDETYMPKEVMDALKEQGVYKDPETQPES
jgi:cytochrome c-type biogenesis protein CcmE